MEMQQLEQGSDGTGLPSVRELVSNGPLDRPLPMPKGGKFKARAQQPPHTLLRHRIHRTRCTRCTCYTVAWLQAALEHSPSCDLHTLVHCSACTLYLQVMLSAYGHLSGALSTLLEGDNLCGSMLKALSWLRHSAPASPCLGVAGALLVEATCC